MTKKNKPTKPEEKDLPGIIKNILYLANWKKEPFKVMIVGIFVAVSLTILGITFVEKVFMREPTGVPPIKGPQISNDVPTKEFLFGKWTTSNYEYGKLVEINWTINKDNTSFYEVNIDEEPKILQSTWEYTPKQNYGLFYETPKGSKTKSSKCVITRLGTNSFSLQIIEGELGLKESRGITRVYRRIDLASKVDKVISVEVNENNLLQ